MNKTKFGPAQVTKPTPLWATYVFRTVFLLLSVATFMVDGYPGLTDIQKLLMLKWFAGINMLVWGLSKMVGLQDQTRGYVDFDMHKIQRN